MAYCLNAISTGTPKQILRVLLTFASVARAKAKANLDNLGFPYRWLGDFVSPAERAAAFAWAQGVKPSELREASFRGRSHRAVGAFFCDFIFSAVSARHEQLARGQRVSGVSFQCSDRGDGHYGTI